MEASAFGFGPLKFIGLNFFFHMFLNWFIKNIILIYIKIKNNLINNCYYIFNYFLQTWVPNIHSFIPPFFFSQGFLNVFENIVEIAF